MVLYDTRGHEIWACPNIDGRAGAEAAELIHSGLAQEIYERSGDWVSITAPPRFRWIARHQPDLFASIAHVGMIGDWILTRLCGAFVTDPSLGSSSAMFDLALRDWSDRILEICGLDRSVLPPVVDPGTVVGEVTDAAAAETGLRPGHPGRRRRRRYATCPTGPRRRRTGARHDRRRHLLAAHGHRRRAVDRRRRQAQDPLPHGPRSMDDRGHRLLQRSGDALVPRRVLRTRGRTRPSASEPMSTTCSSARPRPAHQAPTASSDCSRT